MELTDPVAYDHYVTVMCLLMILGRSKVNWKNVQMSRNHLGELRLAKTEQLQRDLRKLSGANGQGDDR